MTNETTAADLGQGLIPEAWGPRFVSALYDENYVLPHVLNVTGDYKGKGDIVNIATEPAYTIGDTDADGSLDVQEVSITNAFVTIDKNKNVTAEIIGAARELAYDNFEKQFPISAGKALREQMDSDLLALYSDATLTAAGSGLGHLGEDELLAAVQAHVTAKVPIIQSPGECCFALPSTEFGSIKKQGFLDFKRTGEAGGGAAKMEVPTLWNIPVVFSTKVASAASIRYGLLFHKSALAWAVARNVVPKFADRIAAAKDSYLMTVLALYGVKTIKADRMVQLKSVA